MGAIPQIYFGIPAWVYLGFCATVVTFAVCLQVWQYVSVLAAARGENRLDHPGVRLRFAVDQVLGQERRVRDGVVGYADVMLLWACIIHVFAFIYDLFRSTVVAFTTPIVPDLTVPFARDIWAFRVLLAMFAAVGLAAGAVSWTRRCAFPLRGRQRSHTTIMLLLIGIVFAGSLVESVFYQSSRDVAAAAWWAQMAAMLCLILYLPFSRNVDILAAPVSAFCTSLTPSRLPPPNGDDARDEFTWRELLNGLACADCGRCEQVCSVFASDAEESPRNFMRSMKARVLAKSGRRFTATEITPAQIWACDTCGACMDVCPSMNEHVPLIVELRRRLIAEGRVHPDIKTAIDNVMLHGNSLGIPQHYRAQWTAGLDFRIADAREIAVDYLWFVGDFASTHPDAIPATLATARILHRARVNFGILYDGERTAGNDLRRVGAENAFELVKRYNLAAFQQAHFKKIITTDPHTYNVLRNEYDFSGAKPRVLHTSELLEQLLRNGTLPLYRELHGSVAYQEPCYLARYNVSSNRARHVIEQLGLDLARSTADGTTFCCGAGGGRIWQAGMAGGDNQPAARRLREIAASGYVHTLLVSCPKDLVMFKRALITTGLGQNISVRDISELVDEATSPAVAHAS